MSEPSIKPFTGWPEVALEWFDELEANNNRAWFQAHRHIYDEAVRGPLESLLAELDDEFGEGKVSRPNRDIRFSADKSPYKLQIYATVPHEGGGGWYVQLRRDGLFAGGGLYDPERTRLAAVRSAIADDHAGSELEAIVTRLESDGLELMLDGALKTAPRGYATDHPRIELLRLPHLAAGVSNPPRKWLHTRRAKDRVVQAWRAVTPLLDWVTANAWPRLIGAPSPARAADRRRHALGSGCRGHVQAPEHTGEPVGSGIAGADRGAVVEADARSDAGHDVHRVGEGRSASLLALHDAG